MRHQRHSFPNPICSLATGLGVQHLGAHTILRQLMGFWLQIFLGFNACAHSLVATNLSRRAEGRAASVLTRIAQLAVAVSIPLGAALFASRGLLPDLFTADAGVRREVAEVLPLLLIIMVGFGGLYLFGVGVGVVRVGYHTGCARYPMQPPASPSVAACLLPAPPTAPPLPLPPSPTPPAPGRAGHSAGGRPAGRL